MRFSVQLPTDKVDRGDEFVSGRAVTEMARAIEAAGFDACFVTDHPFPGARWLEAGGHHALDPFVALSFAAAATERLRLQTNALVLAYRNPFIAAKAAASVDVLSGGRLILGVVTGYLKGEFAALGADFLERNELADEAIRAMRRAWSGERVELSGRHFDVRGNVMRPVPRQQPHPPIWIGGNSRRAIRRAIELGDGWIPFPTSAATAPHLATAPIESLAELEVRIGYLRAQVAEAGRTAPLDICFVPFGFDMFSARRWNAEHFLATVKRLEGMGLTWLTLTLPGESRAEFCEHVARFGEEILARVR